MRAFDVHQAWENGTACFGPNQRRGTFYGDACALLEIEQLQVLESARTTCSADAVILELHTQPLVYYRG